MRQAAADYAAGRMEAAEAGARAILAHDPTRGGARHLFAACRLALGNLDEGAAALEAVIAAAPGRDEVRLQLAEVRARQGRHGDVVALLGEVVARRPDLVAAYRPLAAAQWETGARTAAIESWRALLARVPGDGATYRALGDALRQQGEAAAAVPVLRRALALLEGQEALLQGVRLGLAEALVQRVELSGGALEAALDEAAGLARAVLAAQGCGADCLVRAGYVLHRAGDQGGAEACYAATLEPDRANAHLSLSFLRLVRGDFARGWAGYEWRRRVPPPNAPADTVPKGRPRPAWIVSPRLDGMTVRVAVEQGLGDTLQFVRYLPLLAARGARVELAAPGQDGVLPLLRTLAQVEIVAAVDSAPRPDVVVPLLSLPLAFGTDLATIPASVPYLEVPAERLAVWRARLGAGEGRPRVGVAWRGNPDHVNDRHRSIPLAAFRDLLARPGLAFHVLTDRLREGEREMLEGLALVHEGVGDFADTAALAQMMDLVVAVDTSVVHLAGALGRPTWVLLPFLPDWRWLLGREDSPWYPTMRLFRQPAPGAWDDVRARVGEALDDRFR